MCHICGKPDYITCSCSSVECVPCTAESKCVNKIDAECVIYHIDDDKPTQLGCLGIPNQTSVETALEIIDSKLCNASTLETPITEVDSATIDFSATGPAKHTIQAVAKISSDEGNVLTSTATGLYAPPADGKIKVNESDTLDYLINQIEGGTDGIITLTISEVDGQVVVTPSLNIPALITLLQTDYNEEWCSLIDSCAPAACEVPTDVQVVKATIAPNAARVTWTATNNGNVTGYEIQYKLKTATSWTTYTTITNGINTAIVLGLTNNVLYDIRVVTVCEEGGPTASDSVEYINLSCPTLTLAHTDTSVTASFTHAGGNVDGYILQLLDTTGTHVIKTQSLTSPFSTPVSYTFTGLGVTEATNYKVRLIVMAGAYVKNNCPLATVTTDPTEDCATPVDVTLVDTGVHLCTTHLFSVSGNPDDTWSIAATLCNGTHYTDSGLVSDGTPPEICAREGSVILSGAVTIAQHSLPCASPVECKVYTFQVFGPDDAEYLLRATLCDGSLYNSGKRLVGDGAHEAICARKGTVFIDNYGSGGLVITDDTQNCTSTGSCFSYNIQAGSSEDAVQIGYTRCNGVEDSVTINSSESADICAREDSVYTITGTATITKNNVCSG